ncbi:MAG: EAL domain-containing protein [Pseudolabrys sp.]|nr:EAL domain-containing protein [Pseudolabrys sp.]
MDKLFAKQLGKATRPDGEVDLAVLEQLVVAAYTQAERDRRLIDRSTALMAEELEQLNRGLEQVVEERTAALRDREARLAGQNLLIDTAINNMPQGLIMFDSDARVVIFNQRYLEMSGLRPDQVRPGQPLIELLHLRIAMGTFAGDPDQYISQLLAAVARGETGTVEFELAGDRTIAVTNRPRPDGGWVATHEDISERRRTEKKIAHMAHHDALTDLPNRLLMRERLAATIAEARTGKRAAVFCLDLDNFKTVNDTLGHQFGDELLKCVADRLRACVDPSVTVARVGGDEFALILPNLVHSADAAVLAQHICETVRAPVELAGHPILVDTSIGIVIVPDHGTEPDELLKHADMALYRAKADGRGSYRYFEPSMDARLKARRALERELRQALVEGQFVLHYQPILNLESNAITCCEALVRWQHPARGMIPPAEFIPVAEEIGLIVALGEWVLRKACADAASWPGNIKVAVNLSPIQMGSANLVPTVIGALASAGLPACRLELEITESVMIQNTDATLAALHQLRHLGVKISMDDFGTGYSALSYLRLFAFDKLKIDRCFVNDLSHDASRAIVRAVTDMARSLGMITTAEGVETAEQLDHVRLLGCDEVQGFYISRPQPLAAVHGVIAAYAPLRAKSA